VGNIVEMHRGWWEEPSGMIRERHAEYADLLLRGSTDETSTYMSVFEPEL